MRYSFGLALAMVLLTACGGSERKSISAGAMPQGGTYHGVWQSPQYGNMHLCVSGTAVVGDYEKLDRRGRIQGRMVGDLLRFDWTETRELVLGKPTVTRGRGYFRLKIGGDGDQYLVGEWGFDNADHGGGPWRAAKMRKRKPERCLSREAANVAKPSYESRAADAVEDVQKAAEETEEESSSLDDL